MPSSLVFIAVFVLLLTGPIEGTSVTTCTSFTPLFNATSFAPYRTPYGTQATQVTTISNGVTCPNSSHNQCFIGDNKGNFRSSGDNYTYIPTLIGGLVTYRSSLSSRLNAHTLNPNATIPLQPFPTIFAGSDIEKNIYAFISQATNMTFKATMTDNLTSDYAFSLEPGDSGFATFTPYYHCIRGVTSGCSESSFFYNDTAIEVCGAMTLNEACASQKDFQCLSGVFDYVRTSAAVAADMTCAPCVLEMQATSAATSPSATTTRVATPNGNAAVSRFGSRMLNLAGATVVFAIVLLEL